MIKKTKTPRYILKITVVTKTTPADRATITKLKQKVQDEFRARGTKNVKVEAVPVN